MQAKAALWPAHTFLFMVWWVRYMTGQHVTRCLLCGRCRMLFVLSGEIIDYERVRGRVPSGSAGRSVIEGRFFSFEGGCNSAELRRSVPALAFPELDLLEEKRRSGRRDAWIAPRKPSDHLGNPNQIARSTPCCIFEMLGQISWCIVFLHGITRFASIRN